MQRINLDEKWCFRRGMLDSVGMLQWDPGELVNLPHDGMIHLDVTKEAQAQHDSGYYPGDTLQLYQICDDSQGMGKGSGRTAV